MHAFFLCSFVQEVWQKAPLTKTVYIDATDDFQAVLVKFRHVTCLPPSGISSPVLPWICWSLWTARNRLIFEDKKLNPNEVMLRSLVSAREWIQAQENLPQKHKCYLKGPSFTGTMHGSKQTTTCNSDASWNSTTRKAGLAWIISTLTSNQLHEGSLRTEKPAADLDIISLKVCSDCQTLIRAIQNRPQIKEIFGIVFDIMQIFSAFASISFCFVPRSENRKTDLLGKQALVSSASIDGKLEAPKTIEEWGDIGEGRCWLCFKNVKGIVLNGSGVLHPHGEAWWSSVDHSNRPRAVGFNASADIIYSGLTQFNSPKNHVSVYNCTNATLSNLHLIAPKDSPNSDGIDIALSNNVQIFNSSIQTGDDCVAINGGSHDINITHVTCGPGHGISIGSLGRDGLTETVENVQVRHCSFNGTMYGARIKTWAGGKGFAKNIIYENITLIDAAYPIIIDQHYCNGGSELNATAVKVSDVTFRNFRGTCADDIAIKLACDKLVNCQNIVMENINIVSSSSKEHLSTYCQYANVVTHFVNVDIKCGSTSSSDFDPVFSTSGALC
ncbi:polygalacturonase [Brassica rapa]|uniref:polygalacturonase n=1 Tax=Brassica campestris TaxID=3711 RepID=UPI00142DE47E|nr:polygalacturonase [Brassica rapa]